MVLSGGAEQPRDLPIPGRDLDGVHYAMEFLPLQNRRVAGDKGIRELWATGKHVVVIGGGDTGSDCVGTSNRHGAKSVTQFELLPMPPEADQNPVWPYWPVRLRTSSSHEEGCQRDWAVTTKAFRGENGKVRSLVAVRVQWGKDPATGQVKMTEVPGTEFELPADLVLLAMGFTGPFGGVLDAFGVAKDARGNARADDRRRRLLCDLGAEGVRGRRYAPGPVAGRLGDPRRAAVRAGRGRVPDGVLRAAALTGFAHEAKRRRKAPFSSPLLPEEGCPR